jgi:phosphohistidine phosphatase
MRLLLFRHGPSEDQDPKRWPNDDDRPLTREGVAETRRAADGLARLAGTPDHLLTSPAVRAHDTAELLHAALDDPPSLVTWRELSPGSSAAPILERVGRVAKARDLVILIGHEPTLSELTGLSAIGEAISLVHLARAGAACLEFGAKVTPGGAHLEWLLTRKQLIRLG